MHEKMIKDIITRMDKKEVNLLGDAFIDAIDVIKEHEPDMYHEIEKTIYIALNGEHFTEDLAMHAIECMEFVIPEYKFTYTPEQIEQSMKQIYQQATQVMNKYNKKAHIIPIEVNKWDMYYVYNMICSDYPLSHGGDNTKISMLAYEFLSDPDGSPCKAYRYYCAMKDKEH